MTYNLQTSYDGLSHWVDTPYCFRISRSKVKVTQLPINVQIDFCTLENELLASQRLMPMVWWRYIDDMFMLWFGGAILMTCSCYRLVALYWWHVHLIFWCALYWWHVHVIIWCALYWWHVHVMVWWCYIDDIFMLWFGGAILMTYSCYGLQELYSFLASLNEFNDSIKFRHKANKHFQQTFYKIKAFGGICVSQMQILVII